MNVQVLAVRKGSQFADHRHDKMPGLWFQGLCKDPRPGGKDGEGPLNFLFWCLKMAFSAEKEFDFPNSRFAKAALGALRPELGRDFEKRSKVSIETNKNIVLLKIVADDGWALNASLHSHTRLLELCNGISMLEV